MTAIITALAGGGTPVATGGGGGGPSEPVTPKTAKEYVRSLLDKLSKLMKTLTTKALAALPGVISATVSWPLRLVGGAASWLAQNLWALVPGVIAIVVAELRSRDAGAKHL